MTGFFPRSSWQVTAPTIPLIAECGTCGLYKHCKSPKMPHTGQGKRKILLLGEAPGADEDDQNRQFCGSAGFELKQILSKFNIAMRRDTWLHNSIICRPHEGEANRTPTDQEISYCRPNVLKVINKLKPDIIIPLGMSAVRSIIPLAWRDKELEQDALGKWVGWQIPSQKLNAWICPTYHPSYLNRTKDPVVELMIHKHIASALTLKGKPWPDGVPNWKEKLRIIYDHEQAAIAIDNMIVKSDGRPLAFDFETDRLKPDHPDATILCCSLSDGKVSIAFPWLGEVKGAMKAFFQSDAPKIAANIQFENNWVWKECKCRVKNWFWDTVLEAHWLNCHSGLASLKFQAFVLLGIPDYDSHLEPYMKAKDSNSPNRLREVEPHVLLEYCAMDALLECLVAEKQQEVSDGG